MPQYKLVEISPPASAVKANTEQANLMDIINQSNDELQDYRDLVEREVARELLGESPLYNKMITIPCRNGKGKRPSVQKRLIDLLINRNGDLLEAVSPKVFEHLNGYAPRESVIIAPHILGASKSTGKVDIYTACDQLYSELGYHSCQDMLNEVEQIKELARSIK
jgi:hypothetical protein